MIYSALILICIFYSKCNRNIEFNYLRLDHCQIEFNIFLQQYSTQNWEHNVTVQMTFLISPKDLQSTHLLNYTVKVPKLQVKRYQFLYSGDELNCV